VEARAANKAGARKLVSRILVARVENRIAKDKKIQAGRVVNPAPKAEGNRVSNFIKAVLRDQSGLFVHGILRPK
jgi:hypothetical protein